MRENNPLKPLSNEDTWSRITEVTLISEAMRRFYRQACLRADEMRIVVLAVPNSDRLELRSFFGKVVNRDGRSRYVRITNKHSLPTPFDLENDDATSLLILDGESLPENLQWTIVQNRLSFPVIMLVLKSAEEADSARRRWSGIFREACAAETLVWPAWQKRQSDHAGVLYQILRLIRLPQNTKSLKLSHQARDFLLAADYDGASHLAWTVNQAVRRYLAMHATSGRLEIQHLVPRRNLRILSSHRAIPALAVVK
jgi:hypothetical protein